jgi:hypothetical protein
LRTSFSRIGLKLKVETVFRPEILSENQLYLCWLLATDIFLYHSRVPVRSFFVQRVATV